MRVSDVHAEKESYTNWHFQRNGRIVFWIYHNVYDVGSDR